MNDNQPIHEPIGHCEACNKPISNNEPHHYARDGILFCETHACTLQEVVDQQQEIVDAGPDNFVSNDWFETYSEVFTALDKNKYDLALKGDHKLLNGGEAYG